MKQPIFRDGCKTCCEELQELLERIIARQENSIVIVCASDDGRPLILHSGFNEEAEFVITLYEVSGEVSEATAVACPQQYDIEPVLVCGDGVTLTQWVIFDAETSAPTGSVYYTNVAGAVVAAPAVITNGPCESDVDVEMVEACFTTDGGATIQHGYLVILFNQDDGTESSRHFQNASGNIVLGAAPADCPTCGHTFESQVCADGCSAIRRVTIDCEGNESETFFGDDGDEIGPTAWSPGNCASTRIPFQGYFQGPYENILWAVDNLPGGPNYIQRFDPETSTFTTWDSSIESAAVAVDGQTKTAWAESSNTLYRLNLNNPGAGWAEVGPLTGITEIDPPPWCVLFPDGSLVLGYETSNLYRVDKLTGNSVLIGQLIDSRTSGVLSATGGDFAFSPEGKMYLVTQDVAFGGNWSIFEVELPSLIVTKISTNAGPGFMTGATWTPDGNFIVSDIDGNMYTYDVGTDVWSAPFATSPVGRINDLGTEYIEQEKISIFGYIEQDCATGDCANVIAYRLVYDSVSGAIVCEEFDLEQLGTLVIGGESGSQSQTIQMNTSAIVLYDTDASGSTAFIRHVTYQEGAIVKVSDTELDGVTPYAVAGSESNEGISVEPYYELLQNVDSWSKPANTVRVTVQCLAVGAPGDPPTITDNNGLHNLYAGAIVNFESKQPIIGTLEVNTKANDVVAISYQVRVP